MSDFYRNFRDNQEPLNDPFFAWGKTNIEFVQGVGVRLWCKNGQGSGFMYQGEQPYGKWEVKMRISGPMDRLTTKVCLLLWELNGNWKRDHHEIDFNESPFRTESHQTQHYGLDNSMYHDMYEVDQTKFHVYGVEVTPDYVSYSCDGVAKASRVNESPGVLWVPHMRTEPHNDPVTDTMMDVRFLKISA
jgi:hypothetical protein